MNKKHDKFDILLQTVVYHEDVERLCRELKEIISSLATNASGQAKEKFRALLQRDIVDHFRFEETVVFPAVKAWAQNDTYDKMIWEYIRLHLDLLSQGEEILALLGSSQGPLSKEDARMAIALVAKLSDLLCSHARHEDEHIVPLIKNNPTLRFLSSRSMMSGKTAFKSGFSGP